jgi:hypothetical protein
LSSSAPNKELEEVPSGSDIIEGKGKERDSASNWVGA